MSLHYIIDGYNVIKQVSHLADLKLKNGRNSFVRILQTYRPQGSLKNKVTIVFDGNKDVSTSSDRVKKSSSNIEIIFSENETADDKIKKMVRKVANPKILVVVTDDKDIQYSVRGCGAKIQTVKQFLKPISKKAKPITKPDYTIIKDKPSLSNEKAMKITKELQDIWGHTS